jgi:hypothetical protein
MIVKLPKSGKNGKCAISPNKTERSLRTERRELSVANSPKATDRRELGVANKYAFMASLFF